MVPAARLALLVKCPVLRLGYPCMSSKRLSYSLCTLVISGDISRILTASGKGNNVYYQLNDYI